MYLGFLSFPIEREKIQQFINLGFEEFEGIYGTYFELYFDASVVYIQRDKNFLFFNINSLFDDYVYGILVFPVSNKQEEFALIHEELDIDTISSINDYIQENVPSEIFNIINKELKFFSLINLIFEEKSEKYSFNSLSPIDYSTLMRDKIFFEGVFDFSIKIDGENKTKNNIVSLYALYNANFDFLFSLTYLTHYTNYCWRVLIPDFLKKKGILDRFLFEVAIKKLKLIRILEKKTCSLELMNHSEENPYASSFSNLMNEKLTQLRRMEISLQREIDLDRLDDQIRGNFILIILTIILIILTIKLVI